MKRRISVGMLVILLLCAMWPSMLLAAEEPDFYMVVSKAEANVGDEAVVEIRVRNAQGWVAYELNLLFDSALWAAKSNAFTTDLNGFNSIVNPELLSSGHVRAVFTKVSGSAGEDGEIVLGKVKVAAKAAGTGTFTLDKVKVGQTGDHWATYMPQTQASIRIGSGSGESGGDADSGQGNDPSTPDTGNKPVVTDSSILVKVLPNDEGVVTVKLDTADLQQAIEKLSGHRLSIVLQTDGAAVKQVEFELPLEQVRSAAGKIKTISINSSLATVYLDEKLLDDGEALTAAVLQLSVAQADPSALPAAAREQVKAGRAVYDFGLKLDGHKTDAAGANEVIVELPYALQQGETGNKVVIYYVSEDGRLGTIKNARFNQETSTVKFSPKHFSTYFPAFVDRTFRDLQEAEWAREAVEALAAREVVDGVGGEQFDPNGPLTRAQFITMLIQAFDLTDSAAVSTFPDAQQNTWYYTAVASARKLGIVEGREDGTFGINDNISRQDLAVMLYRAFRVMNREREASTAAIQFADKADIAEYASEAVAVMQYQGIIDGMDGNIFAPRELSTRAQAAAIIYRILLLE